jgi:glycosyltransferase involved in cell wall biosynthesis
VVLGPVNYRFAAAVEELETVESRGLYNTEHLDSLLEDVDVGIVPSVWEEAYGYVGIEFLAKGMPVIGNAIGGIVEYTRDGETGWLNRSCSAEELARIMLGVIADPAQVVELNTRIREARDDIVLPHARHADEMEEIYRELAMESTA